MTVTIAEVFCGLRVVGMALLLTKICRMVRRFTDNSRIRVYCLAGEQQKIMAPLLRMASGIFSRGTGAGFFIILLSSTTFVPERTSQESYKTHTISSGSTIYSGFCRSSRMS